MKQRRKRTILMLSLAILSAILFQFFSGWRASESYAMHRGSAVCLAVSHDGNRIVTGGADGSLAILDTDRKSIQSQDSFSDRYPTAVAWSPDGSNIAIGFSSGDLMMWEVSERGVRWESPLDTQAIITVEFDRTGGLVLSESIEGNVRISEAASGFEHFSSPLKTGSGISGVRFGPNENQLIFSGHFEEPYWLDIKSRKASSFTQAGIIPAACSLACDSGREMCVIGSWRHEIFVWDVSTRKCTARTTTSRWGPPPTLICCSPDGGYIASVWPRGTLLLPGRIEVFEASSLKSLATCLFSRSSAASTNCQCVGWMGNNKVATGHADGVVRIWDIAHIL